MTPRSEPTLVGSSAAEVDDAGAGPVLAGRGGSFPGNVLVQMGSLPGDGHALTTCSTSLGPTMLSGSGVDQVGDVPGNVSFAASVDVELTVALSSSVAPSHVLESAGTSDLPSSCVSPSTEGAGLRPLDAETAVKRACVQSGKGPDNKVPIRNLRDALKVSVTVQGMAPASVCRVTLGVKPSVQMGGGPVEDSVGAP